MLNYDTLLKVINVELLYTDTLTSTGTILSKL